MHKDKILYRCQNIVNIRKARTDNRSCIKFLLYIKFFVELSIYQCIKGPIRKKNKLNDDVGCRSHKISKLTTKRQ